MSGLAEQTLIFMMGEYVADFPVERLYASNHMWALPTDVWSGTEGEVKVTGVVRFGFTAYAVRLLQDVYFLDWEVEAPRDLTHRQEFGSIESKKAESALYAPVEGKLIRFNDTLLDDPSAINVDKYSDGWLFEMEVKAVDLLTPQAYVLSLDDIWKKTQRTIKGQVNE